MATGFSVIGNLPGSETLFAADEEPVRESDIFECTLDDKKKFYSMLVQYVCHSVWSCVDHVMWVYVRRCMDRVSMLYLLSGRCMHSLCSKNLTP